YPVQDPLAGTFNTGTLQDLQLSTTEAAPQATTEVEAIFNLRSDAEDLSGVAFDAADPTTYTFSTSLSVYDSLGHAHTASLYFRNIGPLEWESYLTIDGDAVGGAETLEFGGDGLLVTPGAPINFGAYPPANG